MATWFWCLTTCALILFIPWYVGFTHRRAFQKGCEIGFKDGYMSREKKKLPKIMHEAFVLSCMQECGCPDCEAELRETNG